MQLVVFIYKNSIKAHIMLLFNRRPTEQKVLIRVAYAFERDQMNYPFDWMQLKIQQTEIIQKQKIKYISEKDYHLSSHTRNTVCILAVICGLLDCD